MNKDCIAIILPVYKNDKAEYIKLSVDSILKQTYQDVFLYVGVDGPVDNQLSNLLKGYDIQENVRVLFFEKNRGLAIVLNDLITVAHNDGYDYIARMDADDIAMPDRFEKQMEYLKIHPEVDVVGGSIEEIDEAGNFRDKRIVYPATPNECRSFFARRNPMAHPAVLFRYRFFEKAGCLYRPKYRQNQDTMLWFDGLMKGCKLANVPDVVLHFRMTKGLFKKRRGGYAFAKKQLEDRLMINKNLGYGFSANVFAYAMFLLMVSPSSMRKVAYRLFR